MTDTKEELSLNSGEEYWDNLDVNDCNFLLRALEREAFTGVVNALRAKGPPSEHTFILLNQLKSALSINDELGRAEIRRAAFDAKLCKVSSVLNPNYDTCTEWSGCSIESRGIVESGPSRGKPFANTSTTSIADQLLSLATTNNEKIDRSVGKSFELLCLPYKPHVPERLRLLLRETDRPEQRIPHPLETIPTPSISLPSTIERSTRSEGRQVPIKKRRQRTSKVIKENKLVELKPQTTSLEEEVISHQPVSSDVPSSSSSSSLPIPTPITPLAVNALLNLTAVLGSAGSLIISPGQPPQSGDAMKTWVSKIHEQEMAASAASNGVVIPPEEISIPSTPTPTLDDSAKKKRRPRSVPVQDPYYLNSCARTRPFQFERATNGKLKPPRGNPDNSESKSSGKRSSPGVQCGSSTPSQSANTPRPHENDIRTESNRNGTVEVSTSVPSTSSGTSPANYSSGVNRLNTPQYSSNSNLKRPHTSSNSARTAPKYYVNNSGVPVPTSSASNTVRTSSNTGGIGGRTASLGSQQLSALHGNTSGSSFIGQKAGTSASNSSINSTGGSSGIGASTSSSSNIPNGEHPSIPEDFGGHDYGFTMPSSSSIGSTSNNGGVRDPNGGIRLPPRVVPRPRVNSSINRTPVSHASPQHSSNGIPPSVISLHSSPYPLQRTGSMTSIRPRSGSRGAVGSIGGGTTMGERIVPNETVTDGIVQATVNTILLEAAQKECANGKRTTVPRELLERENGVHANSPIASSSINSPQSTHSYSSPSVPTMTSSGLIRDSSSSLNRTPIGHSTTDPSSTTSIQLPPTPSTIPSSLHSINTTVSPLHPSLSSSLAAATAAYNEFLKSGGVKLLGSASTSTFPSSNISPIPVTSINKNPSSSTRSPIPPLCSEQIERILRIVHSGSNPSSQPSVSTPSIEDPSQSTQRQYVLQPDGKSYADFTLSNSRPFSSEATSNQYTMTPDELYEQGLLARPSTSAIGGFPGMRSGLQDSQSSPHLFLNPAQHSSAIAALQLASSQFSIPSTSGLNSNGDMSSSRESSNHLHSSPLQQILDRPVVIPPQEERSSSDMKDILEQSCRELR